MMKRFLGFAIFAIGLGFLTQAHGAAYEEELSKLSTGIGGSLEKAGLKTVAFGSFKDLKGEEPGLGKLLTEDLSVDLVNQDKGVSVVDRANLGRLMDEYKLTEEGLVDPENTKKLKLAGIDAIILGTIVPFENTYRVQLKAIATDSAKVVAATRGSITKSESLDQLMGVAQIHGSAKSGYASASTLSSENKSATPVKQRAFDLGTVKVEINSATFYKESGKVRIIYSVTLNDSSRSNVFSYHLVSIDSPKKNFVWARSRDATGFEVAGGATDNEGHTYKALSPFDPLATPKLTADSQTEFKLEYQMAVGVGSKIQIPQTFTFWFEFYVGYQSTRNIVRLSISDYAFDEIQ